MAHRTWYNDTARDVHRLITATTARKAINIARKRVQKLQRRAQLLHAHPRHRELVQATMELQQRLETSAMAIGMDLERQGYCSDEDRERARRSIGEALHALVAITGR